MAVIPNGTNIGDMLYWNGSFWVCLEPGEAGQLLLTQGIGAAPEWGEASGCMVEGDYEAWVYQWQIGMPGVDNGVDADPWHWDWIIDDKRNTITSYFRDYTVGNDLICRFGIHDLTDGSAIFESPEDSNYLYEYPAPVTNEHHQFDRGNRFLSSGLGYTGGMSRSMQSYVLVLKADGLTVEVWRCGGSPLWFRDFHDDILDPLTQEWTEFICFGISPTGKYVLLTVEDEWAYDPPYYYWLLYKGLSTILDTGTSTSVAETTIADNTKAWTPDEWVGKWVKASAGDGAGYVAQITGNSATTITCSGATFVTAGMVSSDEYKILDY